MIQSANDVAVTCCETLLREEIRECEAENLRPKVCAAAKRLLARTGEVAEAYEEVYADLHRHPFAVRQLMAVVCEVVYTDEQYVATVRAQKKRLEEVNQEIGSLASRLASLLDERTALHNTSGFTSETIYSACDLVDRANRGNFLYASHARKGFLAATGPFDLKYWPSLGDCLRELGRDADEAELAPLDPVTDVATHGVRASRTNVVLGLLAAIRDCYGNGPGRFPEGYCPSDGALASLLNVVLDLPPEAMMTSEYIKGVRQRARKIGLLSETV